MLIMFVDLTELAKINFTSFIIQCLTKTELFVYGKCYKTNQKNLSKIFMCAPIPIRVSLQAKL